MSTTWPEGLPVRADGPGLPSLSYSSTEGFQPLVTLNSDGVGSARGHGTVQMVNGCLFVPFGRDSGHRGVDLPSTTCRTRRHH